MRCAIIAGAEVVNIVVASAETAAAHGWVAADQGAEIGGTWSEGGGFVSASSPTPSESELLAAVEAERDRRLAAGVAYDFGDERGTHLFGTTEKDRRGWDEVDRIAKCALAAGQTALEIAIRTDTGDTVITAAEWPGIFLTIAAELQPAWAASWAVKDAVRDGTVTDPADVPSHAAWPD